MIVISCGREIGDWRSCPKSQSSENRNRFHAARLASTIHPDFTVKYQKILKITCNILDQTYVTVKFFKNCSWQFFNYTGISINRLLTHSCVIIGCSQSWRKFSMTSRRWWVKAECETRMTSFAISGCVQYIIVWSQGLLQGAPHVLFFPNNEKTRHLRSLDKKWTKQLNSEWNSASKSDYQAILMEI